jgi:hypothetical protein
MSKSILSALVLCAVLLGGCTTMNVQQQAQVAELNSSQQTDFLTQAQTKNAAASSNFKSTGKVNFKVRDKVAIIDFETNKLNSDLKIIMSVGDKKVYAIESSGNSYIGDGTAWLELDQSATSDSDILSTNQFKDFNQLLTQQSEYVGLRDCPAGKCQVFKFTKDDAVNTVYFAADHLISQVELTINATVSGNFNMQYGKAEQIAAPINAEKINGLASVGKLFAIYSPLFTAAGIDFNSL